MLHVVCRTLNPDNSGVGGGFRAWRHMQSQTIPVVDVSARLRGLDEGFSTFETSRGSRPFLSKRSRYAC